MARRSFLQRAWGSLKRGRQARPQSGVRSEVTVKNPPSGGYTALGIYDYNDTVGHTVNVSETAIRFDGGIPAIYYAPSDLRSLTFSGGKGSYTYTVFNTPTSGFRGGV